MTTLVKGLPVMAGNAPLTITIEYDEPYQGGASGLGASLRVYKGTWNPATTRWEDGTGAELAIPLPRPDQPDVALRGGLTARITHGAGQNIKTSVFPLTPHETAAGIIDLTVDPNPTALILTPDLSALIGDLPTLRTELLAGITDSQDATEAAYAAELLATQGAAAGFDAAGMTAVPLQSDIPALKGFYILTDASVVGQVYEKTTDAAAPVRRADRERPSTAEVTRLSTAIGHTTAASLSAQPTTAGRQLYDGRFWVGSTTNATGYLPSADGKYWRPERDPLLSSMDGVTARLYGADPTGAADSTAAITNALAAKVGRLGPGVFKTGPLIVPKGQTLRGENSGGTTLTPLLPDNGYALTTASTPLANEYEAHQVVASHLTLDATGQGANRLSWTGLRMGGAYRTVEHLRVKEFGVGIKYDQSHTYLNTIRDVSVHGCFYGVVWEAGIIDSGENITIESGVIFGNTHNLWIKDPAWFISLRNLSLDYPATTQILVSCPVNLDIDAGHIENAGGVALLGAVNPGTDAGVIRFRAVDFVNSATATNGVNDLVGPNVSRCVLVFQDCTDQPSRDRFSRVLWRMPGLPTTAPTTGAPWTNTTGVTVRVRTRWTLTPTAGADAVVEGYSGPGATGLPLRGSLFASRGGQAHVEFLTLDVQHGHSVGYGAAGATSASIEFEPLPF